MLQKNITSVGVVRRIEMIDKTNKKLSIRMQCDLLNVNRSRLYYVSMPNSLESLFCLDALDEALRVSTPEILHSDQGKQYTCGDFIKELKKLEIDISMSGKGRCFDNILAERLWRTVKYEEIYLKDYDDGHQLIGSLGTYFDYYNNHRPHMSLGYRTPAEVYQEAHRSLRSAPAAPTLRKATGLNKVLQLTP
jgi:hypothetical protein